MNFRDMYINARKAKLQALDTETLALKLASLEFEAMGLSHTVKVDDECWDLVGAVEKELYLD